MSEKKTTHGIDPALVRELATILSESGLSEIEVEHGELRLRLARTMTLAAAPAVHQFAAPAHTHVEVAAETATAPPKKLTAADGALMSPMVGTAYLSPEPGAPVFIKVGDTVTEGQTLLVVEAMKTFNPIPSPRAGKVLAILVTDAQPVEFGEPLLVLG